MPELLHETLKNVVGLSGLNCKEVELRWEIRRSSTAETWELHTQDLQIHSGFQVYTRLGTHHQSVSEKRDQTLSFVLTGNIHSCRGDKKKQGVKNKITTVETDVLRAALLAARYLPSRAALQHYTHTSGNISIH